MEIEQEFLDDETAEKLLRCQLSASEIARQCRIPGNSILDILARTKGASGARIRSLRQLAKDLSHQSNDDGGPLAGSVYKPIYLDYKIANKLMSNMRKYEIAKATGISPDRVNDIVTLYKPANEFELKALESLAKEIPQENDCIEVEYPVVWSGLVDNPEAKPEPIGTVGPERLQQYQDAADKLKRRQLRQDVRLMNQRLSGFCDRLIEVERAVAEFDHRIKMLEGFWKGLADSYVTKILPRLSDIETKLDKKKRKGGRKC